MATTNVEQSNVIVLVNPSVRMHSEDGNIGINDPKGKNVRYGLRDDNGDTYYVSLFDLKKILTKINFTTVVTKVGKLELLLQDGATFVLALEQHVAGEVLEDGYVVKQDTVFAKLQQCEFGDVANETYKDMKRHILFD